MLNISLIIYRSIGNKARLAIVLRLLFCRDNLTTPLLLLKMIFQALSAYLYDSIIEHYDISLNMSATVKAY